MKLEKIKKSNGVTLIALVVTIVVLLILSSISIDLVIGDNGLITKAKEAKQKTEQDQLNTEIALNKLTNEIESIFSNNSSGNDNQGGDTESGGSSVDLSTLAIGEYVNYTYDTVSEGYNLEAKYSGYDEDQTVTQSSTVLKWRILNIDTDSGTIDLVSEKPSDNTVYFKGALGYNNGVYLLNDMCKKLYSDTSRGIYARSINLADIEKHLTEEGIADRKEYKNDRATYGDIPSTPYETNIYYPNIYAKSELGQGIDKDKDDVIQPNDLDGVDPYKESKEYYTLPTTEGATAANSKLNVTQTYYNITLSEERYGVAADVLSISNSYWLASRCTSVSNSGFAGFQLRYASIAVVGSSMFYSNNTPDKKDCYLRPIVSLSANILDLTAKDSNGAWNLKDE